MGWRERIPGMPGWEEVKNMKVRLKPVEFEAVQWTGMNHAEFADFVGGSPIFDDRGISVDTVEGKVLVMKGDYLTRGYGSISIQHFTAEDFAQAFDEVKD